MLLMLSLSWNSWLNITSSLHGKRLACSIILVSGSIHESVSFFDHIIPGLALVIVGQACRTVAMFSARHNFSHHIADYKAKDHVLVTHGIYRYVDKIRVMIMLIYNWWIQYNATSFLLWFLLVGSRRTVPVDESHLSCTLYLLASTFLCWTHHLWRIHLATILWKWLDRLQVENTYMDAINPLDYPLCMISFHKSFTYSLYIYMYSIIALSKNHGYIEMCIFSCGWIIGPIQHFFFHHHLESSMGCLTSPLLLFSLSLSLFFHSQHFE